MSGFLFDRFSVASAYKDSRQETASLVPIVPEKNPVPAFNGIPAYVIETASLSGSWAGAGEEEE